ncbi:Similar to ints6-a: Integrator complex subunit 6-A (Xenopus laevis) [Cotesia congregata]|uniref:Similar to ints6-a: Integrator complex subunit 6-A (Xenopus laevis) n=1 Tax=Cotesia congregata TaxID=51543 RepID=A0A8J2HNA1_COTCN|nr:Similar to ints6-a: Integrator complex subunit 6-A (Xenopus laevis) [Cotesia congregata]
MTIIVFLIDTSASMNQRAYLGGRPTLLDVAKSAVETFVKVRQRSPESRCDRYMLLTFEDPPQNIKAGWKENLATFMNELKNLQCVGLTTLGAALKHALDVLNINRMQTGIDTYGQGRCPFYLEPSVIVLITDGGKYTTTSGVQQDFTLPMHAPIPGSELTKEPFRWDQRLFSLVLRLSGTPAIDRDTGLVASDASPIDAMCEVTGGRSYCITSHRMMMQCIDSLVQKVQSGVVINFEKIGPDPPPLPNEILSQQQLTLQQQQPMQPQPVVQPEDEENDDENSSTTANGIKSQYLPIPVAVGNTAWHSCRRLIYVPRQAQKGFAVGFWPIPESFWPDLNASSLPPRSAHPNVKFTCTSQEPMVIENLPFDKYELEPSPLTQYILARKQPTTCWQVFVANSYKSSEVGHPFGYLKASTNLTCVNLFVMPYNYPVLLPLLEELFKVHRLKPTNEWRTQFQNYLRTMPTYYAASLRRALTRMGAPAPLAQTLIPDNLDNSLSYSVLNYLKRLKNQAKIEFDRLCTEVISKQAANANANKFLVNGTTSPVTEGIRVIPRSPLKKDLVSHPLLQDKFIGLRDQLNEFGGFVVGLVRNQQQQRGVHSYRNAFDVPRKSLLDQVVRMRANFLQPGLMHTKLLDDDFVHSMPVAQMGNYQEYLKRMTPPLREIESAPVRQHMFGNPFKIDKRMMVDEADMDMVGSPSSSSASNSSPGNQSMLSSSSSPSNISSNSLSSGISPSTSNSKSLKRSLDNSSVNNISPILSRPSANKRKPGPIPKDYIIRRRSYVSPSPSPSASPLPWTQVAEPKRSTSTPIDVNSPNMSTILNSTNLPTPILPNSILPTNSTTDKLTNGLSDITSATLPVFEFCPNETPEHNNEAPPDLVPVTTPNNIQSIKPEIKNEKIEVKLEHNDVTTNNDVNNDNINSVIDIKQENRLGNHVDEKHDVKSEKEKPLTKKELDDVRKHNFSIREIIHKEVRKRGTNYSTLFSHIRQVKGTLDIRIAFVRDIVKESLRFKRRTLAKLLEDYLGSIQEDGWVTNCKINHNGANKMN